MIDENNLDWRADPAHHPVMNRNLRCIILCAPAASGKSTYAQRLLSIIPKTTLISSDDIRAEFGDINDQSKNGLIFNTIIPTRMVGASAQSRHIIIDATNVSRKSRKNLIKQAKDMGYLVEAHIIRTSKEECLKRNKLRERKVPSFVIDRHFEQWQEPEFDEGFDKIMNVMSGKPENNEIQCDELYSDKQRLDFLNERPESVPYLEDGLWRIPYLMDGAGGFGGGVGEMTHRTLRGVIDLAMAKR